MRPCPMCSRVDGAYLLQSISDKSKSVNALCEDLGVKRSTFRSWLKIHREMPAHSSSNPVVITQIDPQTADPREILRYTLAKMLVLMDQAGPKDQPKILAARVAQEICTTLIKDQEKSDSEEEVSNPSAPPPWLSSSSSPN